MCQILMLTLHCVILRSELSLFFYSSFIIKDGPQKTSLRMNRAVSFSTHILSTKNAPTMATSATTPSCHQLQPGLIEPERPSNPPVLLTTNRYRLTFRTEARCSAWPASKDRLWFSSFSSSIDWWSCKNVYIYW